MNRNHPGDGPEREFSDEFLNAFVDGQLSPEEQERVYLRVGRDEAVHRRLCALHGLRDLVRLAYREPPAPPARPQPQPARRRAAFGYGLAAGVVLLLGVPLGWYLHEPAARRVAGAAANGAAQRINVLMHVNDDSPMRLAQSLDEIEELLGFYRASGQDARVEVIINGDGLALVRADVTPFADRIAHLQREYSNVAFLACQNTIERLRHDTGVTARLLPGVVVIDSGVAQLMRRQHQGWAYIQA